MLEEVDVATSQTVENTYKEEIEKQIIADVKELGFDIDITSMDINLETGEISNIYITVGSNKENKISINKIEIKKAESNNSLGNKDIENIKNFLNENYKIDTENIYIN